MWKDKKVYCDICGCHCKEDGIQIRAAQIVIAEVCDRCSLLVVAQVAVMLKTQPGPKQL
jgi:hypothetical protein